MPPLMRVLFIENDDSFSWNIVDRLPVARSDLRLVSGHDVETIRAAMTEAQVVVLGPGPKDPVRAGVVGVVESVVARGLPLLGICLGHQALGLAFGARLSRCAPKHGVRETVTFSESRHFPDFAGAVEVMRYHSLGLVDLPSDLVQVAVADDGVPMAIEHRSLPLAGLQFHPDSFATPRGEALIASFFQRVSA